MTEQAPVQWDNEVWVGKVDSFVRKTNANNREFAEVVIDGKLCSAWDDAIKSFAETCVGIRSRAEVRRKAGSRFWTLSAIEPINEPEGAAQSAPVAAVAAPTQDAGVELRLRCLELAIAAMAGADGRDNAQVIITYATQLEHYALDTTPDAA